MENNFLLRFHFSDSRNVVRCMDSMFSWSSCIWFSPESDLIWNFGILPKFCEDNFFSYIFGGWTSVAVSEIYGGVIFITALSLFHFFRKSKHPEKWSVSFKKLFKKSKCISCYLPIFSNLLKCSFRKTSLFVLTVTGVMEKSVLLASYFK